VKASGEGEGIQDPAELGHRSHVASEQNEGVVGILENGVGDGRIDRVAKLCHIQNFLFWVVHEKH
jgi:hypothetical protein